jgi:acyl-CoA synthetase (NDP forming)
VAPIDGRVAMSTQSGALGLAILDYVRQLNLGISTFVSVGNKADVSGNDLIQYWAEDPRTDVILLYLESFGNPRRFAQIARRVAQQKPIVAVKSGRSRAGARAASSHTGALATSDVVVDALFRQAGVMRTTTLEELFDVAALLAHQPLPAGPRVAIVSNAGGPAILAADACEANGLTLSPLSEPTVTALREVLPAAASLGNPVDMLASATPEQYERATRLLLADENVDSLLVIYVPPLVTQPEDVAHAITTGAATTRKPVIANFISTRGAPPELAPIPSYRFPEAAVTALAHATTYAAWRGRPKGSIPQFSDIHQDIVRRVVDIARERGGGWLTPAESQMLVEAVGISTASARLVTNEHDAITAAREIGYPVALKAAGPELVHKSDVGGVVLDIRDEEALRKAFGDLRSRVGARMTAALVQQMVDGGVELLIGAVADPMFGPLIACGTGGVLVDLFQDSVFRIHPVTDVDANDMVESLKSAPLLRGYRGHAPVDKNAIVEALLRVSALLEICPEIQEVDINPLKVPRARAAGGRTCESVSVTPKSAYRHAACRIEDKGRCANDHVREAWSLPQHQDRWYVMSTGEATATGPQRIGWAIPTPYPVTVTVQPKLEQRNRLTVAFRPILAIPHAILAGPIYWSSSTGLLTAAAYVMAIISLVHAALRGPSSCRRSGVSACSIWDGEPERSPIWRSSGMNTRHSARLLTRRLSTSWHQPAHVTACQSHCDSCSRSRT